MHKDCKPLRIALVTYALRLGGVETFLQNIAVHFRSLGHDVSFVETEEKGEWSELTRQLGFPVISITRQGWLTRRMHCNKVASCLKGFDALLINDSPLAMAVLGLLSASTVSIPVLHNAIPSMIANATAGGTEWQRLVTVAPGLLDDLRKRKVAEEARMTCIPNGVPVYPPRTQRNDSADPLSIIYVGRLEQEQKNIFAIPKILESVIRAGVSIQIDIVGDGPDAARLRGMLESSGANWTMSGLLSREDTIRRMQAADVLLMPSRYEGLPMTLLEAMSCGMVPVVSRLEGSTDVVVEHGVSGFLVNTLDDSSFSEALIRLAKDRILLTTMSLSAQETIRARFSIEFMASAYLRLIYTCRNEVQKMPPNRTKRIDFSLLGNFSRIPYALVRPLRKVLRSIGLH